MFLSNLCTEICPHQAKYLKVGRREAAAARLELNKRKKKKEKLDIEEVPFWTFHDVKHLKSTTNITSVTQI